MKNLTSLCLVILTPNTTYSEPWAFEAYGHITVFPVRGIKGANHGIACWLCSVVFYLTYNIGRIASRPSRWIVSTIGIVNDNNSEEDISYHFEGYKGFEPLTTAPELTGWPPTLPLPASTL
jgi:hypothetical protein